MSPVSEWAIFLENVLDPKDRFRTGSIKAYAGEKER
jgi:hypothetical protein